MASRKNASQRHTILDDLHWHLKEMGVFTSSPTPMVMLGTIFAYWRQCRAALTCEEAHEVLDAKICPIVSKFPENVVSKLSHYREIRQVAEDILIHAGMDETMMWRLLVFLFLGCGGHHLIPWERLRNLPCTTSYDPTHPQYLDILRWMHYMFDVQGLSVMQVIGGDGLDKKSRVANESLIKAWYEAVPALVASFRLAQNTGDMEKFISNVARLPGLRGDLTRKELYCCFAGSTHEEHRNFGERGLVFGPGAQNGAYVFLGIPYPSTRLGTRQYAENISLKLPDIRIAMNARNIDEPDMSVADLETSLCTIVVYADLVHSLRNNVKLRTPAGFRLYINGACDQASVPDIPCLDYGNFRVDGLPARWESRVLRKRPASSITPQLISSVSTRTRGCAGARPSTSQAVDRKDAKHPHECRVCHKYVGCRCRVHCGVPVIYCSGHMTPSRAK